MNVNPLLASLPGDADELLDLMRAFAEVLFGWQDLDQETVVGLNLNKIGCVIGEQLQGEFTQEVPVDRIGFLWNLIHIYVGVRQLCAMHSSATSLVVMSKLTSPTGLKSGRGVCAACAVTRTGFEFACCA